MQIDLRPATLVVTGHWNPRIFGHSWLGRNVLDRESGETIEVGQVFDADRGIVASFYEGVGIHCRPERLELFLSDLSEENASRCEQVLRKVLELLPHTPVLGFGLNYNFMDPEVEAAIVDKLKTGEKFETKLTILQRELTTTFSLPNETKLNLLRKIDESGAVIRFNYHRDVKKIGDILQHLEGVTLTRRKESFDFILEFYGIESSMGFVSHLSVVQGGQRA